MKKKQNYCHTDIQKMADTLQKACDGIREVLPKIMEAVEKEKKKESWYEKESRRNREIIESINVMQRAADERLERIIYFNRREEEAPEKVHQLQHGEISMSDYYDWWRHAPVFPEAPGASAAAMKPAFVASIDYKHRYEILIKFIELKKKGCDIQHLTMTAKILKDILDEEAKRH